MGRIIVRILQTTRPLNEIFFKNKIRLSVLFPRVLNWHSHGILIQAAILSFEDNFKDNLSRFEFEEVSSVSLLF